RPVPVNQTLSAESTAHTLSDRVTMPNSVIDAYELVKSLHTPGKNRGLNLWRQGHLHWLCIFDFGLLLMAIGWYVWYRIGCTQPAEQQAEFWNWLGLHFGCK